MSQKIYKSDPNKIKISYSDTPNIDAFGRLRVSEPFTIFDHKQIFDDLDIANSEENTPLFFDNQETSGSGTATLFNVNKASTTLSVSNATAGVRIRQSKQRFNYQPAKSQLVLLTAVYGEIKAGITKRYGYFDENNGWFFESDGTDFSVVRRTNVTGTPVDNKVIQSNWSMDKLDGLGPSGITFDINKVHIFKISFQWLGSGRIVMSMDIDGLSIPVHKFLISNIIENVSVSTPNLPIRAEIINDGSGEADSFQAICAAVMVEGELQFTGVNRTHSNGVTHVDANTIGTYYALVGIRLRTSHIGASVIPRQLSVLAKTNDDFRWVVSFNPIVEGTFVYSNIINSAVQGAIGATANTISDLGIEIDSGYVEGNTFILAELETALRLGSNIDGTLDQIVLSVSPFTSNLDVLGSLSWKELI